MDGCIIIIVVIPNVGSDKHNTLPQYSPQDTLDGAVSMQFR